MSKIVINPLYLFAADKQIGKGDAVEEVFARYLSTIHSLAGRDFGQLEEDILNIKSIGPRAAAMLVNAVAPIFQITDPRTRSEGLFAHMCLDGFSHFIDDITDQEMGPRDARLHIASLLLAKSSATYGNLVGRSAMFWKLWETYFTQASEAERHLANRPANSGPFSACEISMIGHKSALLKISLALFASLADNWELLNIVEAAFDELAVGVQMIDDLVDFEEDTRAQRSTFVNSLRTTGLALEQLQLTVELATTVLDSAAAHFCSGQEKLRSVPDASLARLVSKLVRNIDDVRASLKSMPAGEATHAKVSQLIRRGIEPRLGH